MSSRTSTKTFTLCTDDLLCYRKYGHNEGDEPKFTQPNLYNLIAKHPNPKEIYYDQLEAEGVITKEVAKKIEDEYTNFLESEYTISRQSEKALVYDFLSLTWDGFRHAKSIDFEKSPETGVDKKTLLALGKKLSTLPDTVIGSVR